VGILSDFFVKIPVICFFSYVIELEGNLSEKDLRLLKLPENNLDLIYNDLNDDEQATESYISWLQNLYHADGLHEIKPAFNIFAEVIVILLIYLQKLKSIVFFFLFFLGKS
jgi:hypothetical protein